MSIITCSLSPNCRLSPCGRHAMIDTVSRICLWHQCECVTCDVTGATMSHIAVSGGCCAATRYYLHHLASTSLAIQIGTTQPSAKVQLWRVDFCFFVILNKIFGQGWWLKICHILKYNSQFLPKSMNSIHYHKVRSGMNAFVTEAQTQWLHLTSELSSEPGSDPGWVTGATVGKNYFSNYKICLTPASSQHLCVLMVSHQADSGRG